MLFRKTKNGLNFIADTLV